MIFIKYNKNNFFNFLKIIKIDYKHGIIFSKKILKKCDYCADHNGTICTRTKQTILFERSSIGDCGINARNFVRW
jgi:hypothetical protein